MTKPDTELKNSDGLPTLAPQAKSGGNVVSRTDLMEADDLLALFHRAQSGDEAALPAVREMLKNSKMVDIFGGDLARHTQMTLIGKLSGKNLLLKEALIRKLELLRTELLGTTSTPLEKLLVERVVACWLHLHHLETIYAGKERLPPELGVYYERALSASQKRYLAAIKTLALVRRLAVPVLQVNIARKQVNVAGQCVTADGERKNENS